MASNDLFGLDLLFKTIQDNVSKESDVIIALVHWFLVKNSFRCIGIGDDKTLNKNETGSELLPDSWNLNPGTYALRYVLDDLLYILLGTQADNMIVLNLLEPNSRSVSNLTLDSKETVKSLSGPIKTMIPDLQNTIDRLRTELLNPVSTGNTKNVTTQTVQDSNKPSSSRDKEPSHYTPRIPDYDIHPFIDNPLRDVGRGDLNPFGIGGGMLMPQPSNNPWLDRPRHPGLRHPPPPFARFDPIGPPDLNNLTNPPDVNPSHLRPPPDFDDMYM